MIWSIFLGSEEFSEFEEEPLAIIHLLNWTIWKIFITFVRNVARIFSWTLKVHTKQDLETEVAEILVCFETRMKFWSIDDKAKPLQSGTDKIDDMKDSFVETKVCRRNKAISARLFHFWARIRIHFRYYKVLLSKIIKLSQVQQNVKEFLFWWGWRFFSLERSNLAIIHERLLELEELHHVKIDLDWWCWWSIWRWAWCFPSM